MKLTNMSAIQSIEIILKSDKRRVWPSEALQAEILKLGGNMYKCSNIERRLRESAHVESIRVPNKLFVKYKWVA